MSSRRDTLNLSSSADLLKDPARCDVPFDKMLEGYLDSEFKIAAGRGDPNAAVDDFVLRRSVDEDSADSHGLLLIGKRPATPFFSCRIGVAQISGGTSRGVSQ